MASSRVINPGGQRNHWAFISFWTLTFRDAGHEEAFKEEYYRELGSFYDPVVGSVILLTILGLVTVARRDQELLELGALPRAINLTNFLIRTLPSCCCLLLPRNRYLHLRDWLMGTARAGRLVTLVLAVVLPQLRQSGSCSAMRRVALDAAFGTNVFAPAWFLVKFRDHIRWQVLTFVVTLTVFLTPQHGYCALLARQEAGGCLCTKICQAMQYVNVLINFVLGALCLGPKLGAQEGLPLTRATFNSCTMAVVIISLFGALPCAATLYCCELRKRHGYLVRQGVLQGSVTAVPLLRIVELTPICALAAFVLGSC